MLRFMPNKAAVDRGRNLSTRSRRSAENNYDLDPEDLWIKAIYADEDRR